MTTTVRLELETAQGALQPSFDPAPAPAPLQLLDENGRQTPEAAQFAFESAELLELYRLLVIARAVDVEATHLQRQGELALHVPSLGEEAAIVGPVFALDARDWVFMYGREHAVGTVRGIPVGEMFHVWRGTWHGGLWDFRGKCVAPYTIPVGTQVPHAVGFALGAKLDRSDAVTIVFFGDGATSTGDFHEGATMAGAWKVPVVFLCRNNQYAISTPLAKQNAATSIAAKAPGYGFPAWRVDGNDVLACVAVTREAVRRAREGQGPSLIEAVTYRRAPHSTADDPTRYRPDAELKQWEAADPIVRLEKYLVNEGILSSEFKARCDEQAAANAAELRTAIVGAGPLDPTLLFDHVYETPPPSLLRQRERFLREQEGR